MPPSNVWWILIWVFIIFLDKLTYNKMHKYVAKQLYIYIQPCEQQCEQRIKYRTVPLPKKLPSDHSQLISPLSPRVITRLVLPILTSDTLCTLLCLASFIQHNIFEIHPCSISNSFFKNSCVSLYVYATTHFLHSTTDGYVGSFQFFLWRPLIF